MAEDISYVSVTTGNEPSFAEAAIKEGDIDVSSTLPSSQLRGNVLSLWVLLFAVVNCVAPMAAAVFNTAVMAGYAGATVSLDFLIGAVQGSQNRCQQIHR